MNKSKLIPIIASSAIILGIVLTVIGYTSGAVFSIVTTDDGLKAIDVKEIQTISEELSPFSDIDVDLDDADFEIIPSDTYKIEILSHKELETGFTYKVQNNKLLIESDGLDVRFFNISLGGIPITKIKIYYPKDTTFNTINVTNKFGDIHLNGINSNHLTIYSGDGNITTTNVKLDKFEIKNNFGDILVSNVETKNLVINMNDGDLQLMKVVAEAITITNQFGDMDVSDLNSRGLKITSIDGDIKIQGLLLGKSNIKSNFGDVDLQVTNKESELSYNITNSFGDIIVNLNEYESKANHHVNTKHELTINANDGDVNVQFNS